MTGRRGRTVRGDNGRLSYELRSKQDTVIHMRLHGSYGVYTDV
jgi:hypothetical protein